MYPYTFIYVFVVVCYAQERFNTEYSEGKAKVKQFHYRPGQALRVPGGWDLQISRKSAHEGCKFVSPTHRPPLPRKKIFLLLISVTGKKSEGVHQFSCHKIAGLRTSGTFSSTRSVSTIRP